MILRRATAADLPTLYRFEQGIVETERPCDPTLKQGEIHYYDLRQLIESPDAAVMVAEERGEILGSGYAQIRRPAEYLQHPYYVYLGFMYTLPSARGRGVNKTILNGLLDWARSKGINEIRLNVYATNESAKKAYERSGFRDHLVEMRLGLE